MLSAQRRVAKRNIFLRHEQQLGESFDIWCVSPLAAETTEGLLSQVNEIYEAVRRVVSRRFPFALSLRLTRARVTTNVHTLSQ